jgi:ubiquinone/menaquinone biosynthesis C-methylase UbiE
MAVDSGRGSLVHTVIKLSGAGATAYVLGHADAEVQRLLLQGRLYDLHTEHALRMAGISGGMRVLDIGCGPGDVSFAAARLLGDTGTVLGIDAAAGIVDLARHRAAELGVKTVTFEQTTVADLVLDEPVDAVIVRLILMHLPQPAAVLRQLATLVRPGGVIAFSEFDMQAVASVPDIPLMQTLADAISDAFRAVGLDPRFGTRLYGLFLEAGLPAPRLTMSAPMGPYHDVDLVSYALGVWQLLLPIAEQFGLIPDELGDLDTFTERVQAQAHPRTIIAMPALISAWSRLPTLAAS